MDKLILADIQALATSPDYAGRGFLQSSSAVLGLSAALFMSDLTLWQGSGYKLTDGEIDDIQAMIAQLEEDLMLTGDMYAMDRVKVTKVAAQTIPDSTFMSFFFDVDIYDPSDMHSETVDNSFVYVVRDGLHLLQANMTWGASAGFQRMLQLQKYDSSVPSWGTIALTRDAEVSGVTPFYQALSFQDLAVVGDIYRIIMYQDTGGDLDVLKSGVSPYFAVVRL